MHILLTVHQFLPEHSSGTEVLTYSVAKELQARGHQVTVFTGHPARELMPDSKRFDSYEVDDIPVYRFHHAFLPMGKQKLISEIEYNNHLSASYFKGLLDGLKPDVIHFFHFSRLGIALVDVARELAIAAYYTPTDFWSICPTSQLLLPDGRMCAGPSCHGGNCVKHIASLTTRQRYSKAISYVPDSAADKGMGALKAVNARIFPFGKEILAVSTRKSFTLARINALQGIISPTELMTDVLTHNGVTPDLVKQSAYGINVTGFKRVHRRYSGDRPITLGYIGTLAPHKGCHVLLDALNYVNKSYFRLKIYGSLEEFPDYAASLLDSAKDSVEINFCGTFPNERIADVLSEIDALIVPSVWYENTPLVIYSALAAQCPVIASNFRGMTEVVQQNKNGLLFTPNDPFALSACLARLHQEPTLLEELSNNCDSPKSIQTYVDELIEMYRNRSQAPRYPLPEQQEFEGYHPAHFKGYISGWAVIETTGPLRISLIDSHQVIGSTTEFFPRPDVRNALNASGKKIKTIDLGFQISLKRGLNKAKSVIEIESRKGQKQRIPYDSIEMGQACHIGKELIIALDHEQLPAINDVELVDER